MIADVLIAAGTDNPADNPIYISVTATLAWLNTKVPGFPYIVLGVIVAAAGTWIWRTIRKVRVEADLIKRADAAENALVLANAEVERLRLILQVIAVSLARKDSLDHGPPPDRPKSVPADGLRNLCEWIVKVLAIERADINKMTVWVPAPDGKSLRIAEFHGMGPESARALTFEIRPMNDDKDSFAAMAFRNGRIEICADTQSDPRYNSVDKHPPSHPYRSIIAVPIRNGGDVVGVYTIDSREPGRFSDSDSAALQQYDLYARLFALFFNSQDTASLDGVTLGDIVQTQINREGETS